MPIVQTNSLTPGVHPQQLQVYNGRTAIKLTKGYVAWVDDADFARVAEARNANS